MITQIFSTSVRLPVSLLTEEVEQSEKGKYTNESMFLSMFYLKRFFRWTKSNWWAIEKYLFVYKLSEIADEWIFAIILAEIIFNSQNR